MTAELAEELVSATPPTAALITGTSPTLDGGWTAQ